MNNLTWLRRRVEVWCIVISKKRYCKTIKTIRIEINNYEKPLKTTEIHLNRGVYKSHVAPAQSRGVVWRDHVPVLLQKVRALVAHIVRKMLHDKRASRQPRLGELRRAFAALVQLFAPRLVAATRHLRSVAVKANHILFIFMIYCCVAISKIIMLFTFIYGFC